MLVEDQMMRKKYLGSWASDIDIELHETFLDNKKLYYATFRRLFSPYDGLLCLPRFDKHMPKGFKYELLKSVGHVYRSKDAHTN